MPCPAKTKKESAQKSAPKKRQRNLGTSETRLIRGVLSEALRFIRQAVSQTARIAPAAHDPCSIPPSIITPWRRVDAHRVFRFSREVFRATPVARARAVSQRALHQPRSP